MLNETKEPKAPKAPVTTAPEVTKAPELSPIERARAHASRGALEMGSVVGLPDGMHPYWFAPEEVGEGRARTLRASLADQGYERFPDAWVAGVTGAEVWACSAEVHEVLVAAKRAKHRQQLAVAAAPTK